MDFSRPTNSGMTLCGYTTTSRSGRTGRPWMETDLEVVADSVTRRALNAPIPLQNAAHRAGFSQSVTREMGLRGGLSLIHISEPTRLLSISYAVFCLKKK